MTLEGARNEQLSFQVAVRLEDGNRVPAPVRVVAEDGGEFHVRIRRVGYVPVLHHNSDTPDQEIEGKGQIPGYVPDPLFPEDHFLLPAGETHSFWITLRPGRSVRAGRHTVRVSVFVDGRKCQTHAVKILLHDLRLRKRRNFSVTHWFYIDALMDFYGIDQFEDRFFSIAGAYMRNMAEHGQDVVMVPAFTPSLDGVKRPSQLLHITKRGARYSFDWCKVRAYVDAARRNGITHFEWPHLFTQWGAQNAVRVYDGHGFDEKLLWPADTPATSGIYRNFLKQFLQELHQFLGSEGLVDKSYFHISDEPHGAEALASYNAARNMVREVAPWLRAMDALSDNSFAGHVDIPVPTIRVTRQFVDAGVDCWTYYCCGPRGGYINRLMDTPLAKIAMHGFLFHRWPVRGFLHWGYNYWYRRQTRTLIDPFAIQDGAAWPEWAYGDPFVVYPGKEGPIDSIRWEVFAESLQDYALLQTLRIDREDTLLQKVRDFDDFPKEENWRRNARRRLFRLISGSFQ